MKHFILLCLALLLPLFLLCGCGEFKPEPLNQGETYLEGFWYLEEGELRVGYNLFSDGGGFLFIGETVVPIRYGLFEGDIYISDNGNVEVLPFLAAEEGLWIDGMLFRPMDEDPEISAAVESIRSEAQQNTSSSPSQIGTTVTQLVTLAAAVGVVVILVQFFRKRKKS